MSRRVITSLALCCLAFALTAGSASAQTSYTLDVAKVGNGYVSGPGIACGTDCSQAIPEDCAYDSELGFPVCDPPAVSLTATSANGFQFNHWTGCDGDPSLATCDALLLADHTVTAYFDDVQNPTVSLTAPATTATVGGTIGLAATAADNAVIDRVEFYVRNVKVGQDTTAPYSLSFNTTSVADGPALIEAMAVDSSNRTSARSGRTVTIANTGLSAPVASAAPVISGTAALKKTLTSSTGTWSGSPTSYSYSWLRCDAAGANCAAIGTTDATNDNAYTPVKADAGRTLRVVVLATNAAGTGTSISAPTAVVSSGGSGGGKGGK